MRLVMRKAVAMTDKAFLRSIQVAAPCNVGWENMQGDYRVRYCDQCKLNVYNLSEMTETEIKNLLQEKESNACIRLYRRKDGTVLTDNCPVGLRYLRNRLRTIAVVGAIVTWLIGIAAHAQGLVGAPAGAGRYGQSPEVDQLVQSRSDISDINFAIAMSHLVGPLITFFRILKNKGVSAKVVAQGVFLFLSIPLIIQTISFLLGQ
jgi:hypothetical protein